MTYFHPSNLTIKKVSDKNRFLNRCRSQVQSIRLVSLTPNLKYQSKNENCWGSSYHFPEV